MDKGTLSGWVAEGGMWIRTRQSAGGVRLITSVVYSGRGWMVDRLAGLGSVTGPEEGRAGMVAADRAALELGWTLEGGPAAPPVDVSALQAEVARLTAELAEAKRLAEFWAGEGARQIESQRMAMDDLSRLRAEFRTSERNCAALMEDVAQLTQDRAALKTALHRMTR